MNQNPMALRNALNFGINANLSFRNSISSRQFIKSISGSRSDNHSCCTRFFCSSFSSSSYNLGSQSIQKLNNDDLNLISTRKLTSALSAQSRSIFQKCYPSQRSVFTSAQQQSQQHDDSPNIRKGELASKQLSAQSTQTALKQEAASQPELNSTSAPQPPTSKVKVSSDSRKSYPKDQVAALVPDGRSWASE